MSLTVPDHLIRQRRAWFGSVPQRRRLVSALGLALVVVAPLCAIFTYYLATSGQGLVTGRSNLLRVMLVIDFCLALALIAIIAWRIATLVLARRARSAGSRLHLRMVRMFTIIAVAPALLLGLFAAISVTVTLESWLNDRVGGVVRNSVQIAESFVKERHQTIRLDASVLSAEIARISPFGSPRPADLVDAMVRVSTQRRLTEVYVIDSTGKIIARGPNSYLFLYQAPDERHLKQTKRGEVYVYEDQRTDAIRALAPLDGMLDAYLYIARPVDGEAARVLAETRSLAREYERLEAQRGDMQILFAVLYIGFAIIIVSVAIWLGIWVADRLARPIGRLAGAADRVARGDLNARVHEEHGDDEIATLSRAFNRMTGQVQLQRDALLDVNDELDQRRRFTEAVISGVTAGVVGLDAEGRVDLMNGSVSQIVGTTENIQRITDFEPLLPGIRDLVDRSQASPLGVSEGRVMRMSEEGEREYLVRVTCQRGDAGVEGYVLTLDDMTALVSAQRLAAWGDVAQRVAHEIRNPLTPIQLSAERLRRKFGVQIGDNRPVFDQCVDTIVRQVGQIRRMVEEFSNFARMPKPEFATTSLDVLFGEILALHSAEYPDITFEQQPQKTGIVIECDRGLMSQAFTNLVRNAAQSLLAHIEMDTSASPGRIVISTTVEKDHLLIDVIDNGPGFPRREREKLTEPYVTTRKGGTGLGLAIVRRIVEEHDGTVMLKDAEGQANGAQVRIRLPYETTMVGMIEPAEQPETGATMRAASFQ